jgi:hypothetical protein
MYSNPITRSPHDMTGQMQAYGPYQIRIMAVYEKGGINLPRSRAVTAFAERRWFRAPQPFGCAEGRAWRFTRGAIHPPLIMTSVKGNSANTSIRITYWSVSVSPVKAWRISLPTAGLLYQSRTVELPTDPNHFI